MKKLLYILLPVLLLASSFEDFKNDFKIEENISKQEEKDYINSYKNDFKSYKKVYNQSFKEYLDEINRKWPNKEVSTKTRFVQYSKNYNNKRIIDYNNEEIIIEVHAKNEIEARKKINSSLNYLLEDDVNSAYKNDHLEKKIIQKTKKTNIPKSNEKIISDILNKKTINKFKSSIKKAPIKKNTYKNKNIYSITLKMPTNTIMKKAKLHKFNIKKHSNKMQVPRELVYAIMHSESSFNPMARSHIPAYGLMQIVPRSAGIDAYNFIYKQKKMLSSSYLYNANNNIEMGAAYLHILNYKYLRKIKNKQSRLYCVIAAYNTGSGNVARAFISSTNINKAAIKINNMSSDEVYSKLIRNLPYQETKFYLKKVYKRVQLYRELTNKDLL